MYCNIASLTLGFTAWLLACLGIRAEKDKSRYQIGSFSFCCSALLFQFLEIRQRMLHDDWTAVDDTIHAVLIAATVLVLGTVGLNLLCERSKRGGS